MDEIKLKTFPLTFTEEHLRQIETIAGKGNIKRFIMKAIEEKMLIESIDKALHDKAICPQCNGSGEGMHDGTKCKLCKGSGEDE